MKYVLPLLCALIGLVFVAFPHSAHADVATQSSSTNITVTVAGNTLTLSGYIAPYASVVLTINNTVITSTVADSFGNFSFNQVAVPKSTSTVCLSAVDFKKLGESLACISVTSVNGVITKTNVFLPPTFGVQRTEVTVGDSALAFGYSMPGAIVTVHVNGLTGCTVTADKTGYYQCSISIQKVGNYELYADAVLQGKPSEQQLKKIIIKGVTLIKPTPFPTPVKVAVPAVPALFAIPWWVWLLLVLIVIILIIILLRRFRPEAIPAIGVPAVPSIRFSHLFDFLFKSRKLHHWWMKGVGF